MKNKEMSLQVRIIYLDRLVMAREDTGGCEDMWGTGISKGVVFVLYY